MPDRSADRHLRRRSERRTRAGAAVTDFPPSARTLVPLFAAYFALAALYAWQAWRRETPTIFTDELELTQISRSIADTGEPARRGDPYGFTSLAPWLTAPAWWIHSVADAFETVKYLQTLVMTAAIFPAYALARHGRLAALGALRRGRDCGGACALVRADPRRGAARVSGGGAGVPAGGARCREARLADGGCGRRRLPARGGAALAARRALRRARPLAARAGLGKRADARWRSSWTAWDWAGAVVLGLGAVFLASAVLSTASHEWARTTVFFKGRIVEYGLWAAGAFAIGVGILPVIAALASLVRPRTGVGRPAPAGLRDRRR